MRRTKFTLVLLITVFALALPAEALLVTIENVELNGGGSTAWDPLNGSDNSCTKPMGGAGYASVGDGKTDMSDGFDTGLQLRVNNQTFYDADGQGNESGDQVIVGPTKLKGLSVKRIDRALPGSPTLRSLAVFRNSSSRTLTRTISLTSQLGSDGNTIVVKTSSGDAAYAKGDRWIITAGQVSDPPVTHILFGKRAQSAVKTVRCQPTVYSETGRFDSLSVDYSVSIPAKSTRYLLFFAQMHLTGDHGAGHVASIADAGAFDAQKLNAGLLDGLSSKVRSNVLNWRL